MSNQPRLLPSALSLALLLSPLAAQGLLVGPQSLDLPVANPTPPAAVTPLPANAGVPPQPQVRAVRTQVHAEITDGVATTTIEQTFANRGGRDGEGTWLLPLPPGAVADGFTMTVGGKETAGEVLDATRARAVYESIVRQRRDPGLLEYAGEGLLRARIFPIPALGEVLVKVRLRQVLQPSGGIYEWRWPVRAAALGDAGAAPITLDVQIHSTTPLRTVLTPSRTADIVRHGEHEARISQDATTATEDLRILYGLAERDFGLHLLAWRQADEPGYFAMLLSPRRELPPEQVPPRLVQFVLDTSGSMFGTKLLQAKAALRQFVTGLRPQDRFQILTFATDVQPFFPAPRLADEAAKKEALARIETLEARGGTNLGEALRVALAAVPADATAGPLAQVVLVTDGEPTVGLTRPEQILAAAQQSDRAEVRVFALGVGFDIDVPLLDDLVQQHRGAREFVRPDEPIEGKAGDLCARLAQPALTDVEVRCDGLDAFDVHPARTRDLFCGETLQLTGRYRGDGKRTVLVRGKVHGTPQEFRFDVEFPALSTRHDFVPTLWARQQIGALLEAIRRNGQKDELVQEVKRLAIRYGVATPFTSQLILEEGQRLGAAARPGAGHFGAAGPGGPATPGPGDPTGPATGGTAAGAPVDSNRFGELIQLHTGARAVELSASTGSDDFYLGGARRAGAATSPLDSLRRAAGRSFVLAGDTWLETGLPVDWLKTAVRLEACSDDLFALLRQQPALREVLALGNRVAFRDGSRIVLVLPAKPPTPPAK